jgi:hypothetical protein
MRLNVVRHPKSSIEEKMEFESEEKLLKRLENPYDSYGFAYKYRDQNAFLMLDTVPGKFKIANPFYHWQVYVHDFENGNVIPRPKDFVTFKKAKEWFVKEIVHSEEIYFLSHS